VCLTFDCFSEPFKSRQINENGGTNNQKRFAQIWFTKGPPMGLGFSTPMIGHVVYIDLINKLHWHHFHPISFCLVMS
jgi:hypothetical protein